MLKSVSVLEQQRSVYETRSKFHSRNFEGSALENNAVGEGRVRFLWRWRGNMSNCLTHLASRRWRFSVKPFFFLVFFLFPPRPYLASFLWNWDDARKRNSYMTRTISAKNEQKKKSINSTNRGSPCEIIAKSVYAQMCVDSAKIEKGREARPRWQKKNNKKTRDDHHRN